ncbi:hypothetical protein [Ruegeria conchae]|uniref:Uncharacterized protein n=1 Tax=Ruegeria conchae TaxID=981384 RepID=A0A497ZNG7_9RHOB|nr:hypothetical protein [Ruegeria conchae]RLK10968.1 hypothetical protein CLV75_0956 [Ruegeria conchae]
MTIAKSLNMIAAIAVVCAGLLAVLAPEAETQVGPAKVALFQLIQSD